MSHVLRPGTAMTLTGVAPHFSAQRTITVHDGVTTLKRRTNGELEIRITAKFYPNVGAAVSVVDREPMLARFWRSLCGRPLRAGRA